MRILRRWYGHIALLIANIIFGLNMPVSRSLIPDELAPLTLNFFRIGGACLLFWTASLFVKKSKASFKDLIQLFFASVLGIFINQIAFIEGLSTTSTVTASLLITLLPVFTMILSFLILREPLSWMKTMGVIIGASGALLLILSNAHGHGSSSIKGILLILLSSVCYALYLTLFKKLIAKFHPVHLMKWMFLFSLIISIPFCYQSLINTPFQQLSTHTLWRTAYVVFFATFIAYLLIPVGQRTIRPTTLSMYNYLQPVIASGVAIFIGMDTFGYENIISAVLVFAGVYVVTQSKTKIQVETEKRRKNIARIRGTKEE